MKIQSINLIRNNNSYIQNNYQKKNLFINPEFVSVGMSFTGYNGKSIEELANLLKEELRNAQKAPYGITVKQRQLYKEHINSNFISRVVRHIPREQANSSLKKLFGRTFEIQVENEYKKVIYSKVLNYYKKYQDNTINKDTALKIKKLYTKINSEHDIDEDSILNIITDFIPRPVYIEDAMDYAIQESKKQGQVNVLKSNILKCFMVKLKDIANEYIAKSTIYPNEKPSAIPKKANPHKEEPAINKIKKTSKQNATKWENISSEYEKKSQELIEYLSTIEGKEELTSEEQAKERKIYTEISAIIEDARKNHKSLINKKSESDFPKDPKENIKAKLEYFDKDIFPLMSKSRESALDGAEIFEKFCIKAELPSSNTMFSLSESLSLLPKEMRTDEILNRYLEIMEKIGDKNSPYWESECVANILVTYASKKDRNDVSVETVLRGIALVKKLSKSSRGAQHIISTLTNLKVGSFAEADNLKDDERIISALNDLREYTKDMPYQA